MNQREVILRYDTTSALFARTLHWTPQSHLTTALCFQW